MTEQETLKRLDEAREALHESFEQGKRTGTDALMKKVDDLWRDYLKFPEVAK